MPLGRVAPAPAPGAVESGNPTFGDTQLDGRAVVGAVLAEGDGVALDRVEARRVFDGFVRGFGAFDELDLAGVAVGVSQRLKRRPRISAIEAKSLAPTTVLMRKRRYSCGRGWPSMNTTMLATGLVPWMFELS